MIPVVLRRNVTQEEVLRRVQTQSKERVVLLQQRMSNQASLRKLTGPTLASMRLITMRKPECDADYLLRVVSLPLGEVIGSDSVFDVIHAPIERATGQLGAGYNRNDIAHIMEPVEVHPITGGCIVDIQPPDWEDAVALAARAHDTLSNIALVGWEDIGLKENEPIVAAPMRKMRMACFMCFGSGM